MFGFSSKGNFRVIMGNFHGIFKTIFFPKCLYRNSCRISTGNCLNVILALKIFVGHRRILSIRNLNFVIERHLRTWYSMKSANFLMLNIRWWPTYTNNFCRKRFLKIRRRLLPPMTGSGGVLVYFSPSPKLYLLSFP